MYREQCTEMVESIHMNEGRLLALNNNLTTTFSRETRSNPGSTISEHILFSLFSWFIVSVNVFPETMERFRLYSH